MKKRHIEYEGREENAFSLSTGDLMAGLLFIFMGHITTVPLKWTNRSLN